MRILSLGACTLACIVPFLTGSPARAWDCIVSGAQPKLDGQTVDWKMEVAAGQRCLRGVRSGAMLLDTVKIESPAKTGFATTQGYSFAYAAPARFKGEDSFTVAMSGTYRGTRGTSVIRVNVTVR